MRVVARWGPDVEDLQRGEVLQDGGDARRAGGTDGVRTAQKKRGNGGVSLVPEGITTGIVMKLRGALGGG